MEQFNLKYGSDFVGQPRPVKIRKRLDKECFRNSAQQAEERGYKYYEGFATHQSLHFPFLHAWNVKNDVVVDVTLRNPEEYIYLGMPFSIRQLHTEQLKHKVYGMLDIGMINIDLLRSIDNNLVESILNESKNVQSTQRLSQNQN